MNRNEELPARPDAGRPQAALRFVRGGAAGELVASCELELAAGEEMSIELASGGHWYGHGFSHLQHWPLEAGEIAAEPFAVNNIQSPVWMCSAGWALLADTDRRLTVRLNAGGDGRLRLACPEAPLRLVARAGRDLPAARAALLGELGWPPEPPPAERFADCLFCTWTQYPRCINRERVLAMARQIRAHGYPCSTLIVDDRWESRYGELDFSPDFPDPAGMVRELHGMGFKVWLWVTPFVDREAATFEELSRSGALVPRRDGAGAARLKWWGGTAGLVDLSSPEGRGWFRGRLERLRTEFGVDGFKIDGGDFKYQPAPEESAPRKGWGASGYADLLLGLFAELVPNGCETRTAWLSQRRRVIWRQGGKDSHWGADNGLRAMVRLGLNMALAGYDLFIPDMVPGRVQTLVSDFPLPSDELLVRWTEASALMPLVQFSFFPWNYCEATERAVRGWALVHAALGRYIAEEARKRARTGAPLFRPVWFDSPGEAALYALDDEFMLGADLVAAPVLEPGRTERDVLLPPGEWRDARTGRTHAGGLLRNCPAPCPGMPLFVRAGRDDLFTAVRDALEEVVPGSVPAGKSTARRAAGLDRDLNATG